MDHKIAVAEASYEAQHAFPTKACEDAQASARIAYIKQRRMYHSTHVREDDIDTRVYEDNHLVTFRRQAEISPLRAGIALLQRFQEEEERLAIHDADDADEETIMGAL